MSKNKPPKVYFRLYNTADPEERVENAILWKLLKDLYGDDMQSLEPDEKAPFKTVPIFGHVNPITTRVIKNSARFKYWEDPCFLQNTNRYFKVSNLQDACTEVKRLHENNQDAFVKSIVSKKLVLPVKRGETLLEALGALAYDYCDIETPTLMVQEFVSFECEMRYFIIDNKIVTFGEAIHNLTPLNSTPSLLNRGAKQETYKLAQLVASEMSYRDAVVDIGYINTSRKRLGGQAGVIEYNPMIPGRVGLYNCNARYLAKAIHERMLEDRIHLYQDGALDRDSL